jgi:hypothetical protein
MLLEDGNESCPIDGVQPGYPPDNRNIPIVLDCTTIVVIPFADQNYAAQRNVRIPDGCYC